MTLEDALREDVETFQSLAEERQGRIVELEAKNRDLRHGRDLARLDTKNEQDKNRALREALTLALMHLENPRAIKAVRAAAAGGEKRCEECDRVNDDYGTSPLCRSCRGVAATGGEE